jgi:hypothetical protein
LSSSIADLSGIALATNYNWSFTTEDGTWGTAELIETDGGGSTYSPQIAFDGSGNAIAVWDQEDAAGIHNIWASRFE